MKNVYETLNERGFIAQVTHEDEVKALLANPGAYFYIGFDPTADSLHVGHFVQMMVMAHMQQAGHRPIALMGGGTGMIGDPSGRSDLRQVLTIENIQHNIEQFKEQMKILIDFSENKALMVNNGDWLLPLNYIDVLRDIGPHFTVNRMLAADAYKSRWEKGLTFLEFNYMILQAYDFYILHRDYNCKLQLGGDDQWSNILAGVDLIRRKNLVKDSYGMTFKLLTTSEGIKMGKTAKGALWLNPTKCSPFDFYQYWRNIADADVENCFNLLTFLPLAEIAEYTKLKDAAINEAKKKLAFEITKIVHGETNALAAQQQTQDLFEGKGKSDQMPTSTFTQADLEEKTLLDLLTEIKLFPSKSEGRRMFQQGGVYLNEKQIKDFSYHLEAQDFIDGDAIIRKGKKNYYRLNLKPE